MHSCIHRSLSLNQKEQEKLWSVIKMTKKTAVRSHFNVLFSFIRHWASASVERLINIDKQRLTSIFTCELKAIYVRSSSSFLYSDLSSDLMLVPHILFVKLTGEKKSAYAQRSQRSRSIRTFRTRVQKPRWPHSDGTMKDWILAPVFWPFWTRLPNSLHSFNHNKDRDDVYPLNCRELQE